MTILVQDHDEVRRLHSERTPDGRHVPMPDDAAWTVDSLARYVSAQFGALRELLDERHDTIFRMLGSTDRTTERRFDVMTQKITGVEVLARGHLTRDEYATAHQALISRVETEGGHMREMDQRLTSEMAAIRAQQEGRRDQSEQTMSRRTQLIMLCTLIISFAVASGVMDAIFHR